MVFLISDMSGERLLLLRLRPTFDNSSLIKAQIFQISVKIFPKRFQVSLCGGKTMGFFSKLLVYSFT